MICCQRLWASHAGNFVFHLVLCYSEACGCAGLQLLSTSGKLTKGGVLRHQHLRGLYIHPSSLGTQMWTGSNLGQPWCLRVDFLDFLSVFPSYLLNSRVFLKKLEHATWIRLFFKFTFVYNCLGWNKSAFKSKIINYIISCFSQIEVTQSFNIMR